MAYDPTKNPYASLTPTKEAPASRAVVVTPHDTNDLATYAKALRINTGGTLKFVPAQNSDADPISLDVVSGEIVPILTRRVFATGTTATGIVALYD